MRAIRPMRAGACCLPRRGVTSDSSLLIARPTLGAGLAGAREDGQPVGAPAWPRAADPVLDSSHRSMMRLGLLTALHRAVAQRPRFDERAEPRRLRRRAMITPRREPGEVEINGYLVRYLDLLSLYMEYKDIFSAGIYHFDSEGRVHG